MSENCEETPRQIIKASPFKLCGSGFLKILIYVYIYNIDIPERDCRTGYLVPVRYGLGSGRIGELSARRRRRHLESQVDILAVEPT